MKKFHLTFGSLLLLCTFAYSQNNDGLKPCGYTGIDPWLVEYQKSPVAFRSLGDDIIYVPLTIHLVGSDSGTGFFPAQRTLDAICQLNKDFETSNIQFFLASDFHYISNSEWDEHSFRDGRTMMRQNNVDGTANVYFVGDPAGNCGYFDYQGDAVAIARGCAGPGDHTFAHEMGHFFSLPHTFFGWEGEERDWSLPAPFTIDFREVEKVDGSNCEDSGDGFCDTPPDYLSFRWGCDGQGKSNITQHDPDNMPFRSDGTLFMSYSFDNCGSRFSEEQMAAMRRNIQDTRSELMSSTPALNPIAPDGPFVASFPEEGETISTSSLVLSWEPVPNATGYFVEVSFFQQMNLLIAQGIVTDNTFIVPNLQYPNRDYFWRIRAFNEYNICTVNSPVLSFHYSTVTSVEQPVEVSDFSVYPVPVRSGKNMQVLITSERDMSFQATLHTVTGQKVGGREFQVRQGENILSMQSPSTGPGLYLLSLENEEGEKLFRKIVVQ